MITRFGALSRVGERGLSSLAVVLGFGGVLAALALGWWFAGGRGDGGVAVDPDRAVQVERHDLIDAVSANGRVEPIARVAVMSRASGIIEKLWVDEGDVVTVGQVLVELDREQLDAQIVQDRADLLSADARLAGARAAVAEAELLIDDPVIPFLQAEAERQVQLYERNDTSLKAKEDAARELATQLFEIDKVRARLPVLAAAVAEAEADRAASQAALERSQTTLREATIRCPIDGVVLTRDKEVGDGVSSILTAGGNATQILSLGDLSVMHVEARVDEVDLGRIHTGMPAIVTVDAHRGVQLEGAVERIAPAGSVDANGIVTFEVRVTVQDPEGLLRPDMTADAKLVVDRRPAALTLPQRAFRREQDGWSVAKVVGEGGAARVTTVRVSLGLSDGLQTEVLEGLAEGDRVLIPEHTGGRRGP